MGASQNYNVSLNINANAQSAEKSLQTLQRQLQQISNMKVNFGVGDMAADIEKASQAAMKLSAHLSAATNAQTGNLDFAKFYTNIQKSGASLEQYVTALQKAGPVGQRAFIGMADAISKAEIPLTRTSKAVDKMWDGLKRTAGWQLQSSLIHGIIGGVQKAIGYARDLDKSLTDIRIVTGQSADQMAHFAQQANKAAKQLNTTTTEYTKASLIYYQQGLSDAEVKARTETTLKMANVTGTTAQKVSDQMTAIWNNYDNGTKSLTHYADVMTALGAATASSTDEIAQGLQKFASISNTVGLSYEYAATALATITAESRESADVVGNALKTLFSRIQGLQLGETLEDGTTLNKYSTALAKVGISIKDQSGSLKNMDDILNEMGAKWETLARDEKMALAQTVAGVRQYTQLMTLMENWDDFQKNLNTANTSAGTLDSQAAIFAEGWEAASDRVRTSWESLWQALIKSDSATTVFDTLSKFIDGLATITQSIGGLKGVLTSVFGVALKVFSPKITEGLSNMAYGIGMMFGGKASMEKTRMDILQKAHNSISQDSAFGVLYGAEESRIRQSVLKEQLNSSIKYAENRAHMSPFQHLMEQNYANQAQIRNQARIAAAAKYDTAAEKASDAYWDFYEKDENGKLVNRLEQTTSNGRASRIAENAEKEYLALQEKANRGEEFTAKDLARIPILEKKMQLGSVLGSKETINTSINQQQAAMAKYQKTISDLSGITDATERLQKFDEATQEYTKTTGQSIEGQKKLRSQIEFGQFTEANAAVSSQIQFTNRELANQIADELGYTSEEDRAKVANRINSVFDKEAAKLGIPGQLSQEERDENYKQTKVQAGVQAAVYGAQGLMSTAAAISSFEGLVDQINQVADGAGSATGVLGALAGTITSTVMGISGFSTALTTLGVGATAALGWAAAIVAVIATLTLAAKAIDNNNISEKERIKTLQQSDAELKNSTESIKKLTETQQTQNNNYLEQVEKVKTISMENPDQLAIDIFEANKQAFELISKYGLKQDEYRKNSAGLIEIDKQILDNEVEATNKAYQALQRTSMLSSIIGNRESVKKEISNLLDTASYSTYITSPTTTMRIDKTVFGTANNADSAGDILLSEAWSFDELLKIYGTKEWDKAKAAASAKGFEKLFNQMEEQILDYQNTNNLLNLAMRNNVDYLLKEQEYTLEGFETFASLGYKKYQESYNKEYDRGKFSGTNSSQLLTAPNQKRIREYLEAQGYTEIGNIDFKGDDVSQFTFTHSEGEGNVNLETIRKWDAEQLAADNVKTIFGTSMDVLEYLHNTNKEAAPGLMSLLTGDNFANATWEEMNAAKEAINTILTSLSEESADVGKIIQDNFGITVDEFRKLYNIGEDVDLSEWFKQFQNFKSSAEYLIEGEPLLQEWFKGESANIAQKLTQNTLTSLYEQFKKVSLISGHEAGNNMLKGITQVLKNSGLDDDDIDAAMQGLLAIDWSDALSSGGTASTIIESLGGTLNMTTSAWESFASAMQAASGVVPDFSGTISQLTDLLAVIKDLTKGDLIDSEIVTTLIGKYPELANLFVKHYSGDYTFIGDENDKNHLANYVWDDMVATKQDAADKKQEYDTYMESDGKNEKSSDQITINDFEVNKLPDGGEYSYGVLSGHATKLAKIAGFDTSDQMRLFNDYYTASNNLDDWTNTYGHVISGGDYDGQRVRLYRNADGQEVFQTYNSTSKTWDDATGSLQMDLSKIYQAAQTEYGVARDAINLMLEAINALSGISVDWKPEEVESTVSAMGSAVDVFEKIRTGTEGLVENDSPDGGTQRTSRNNNLVGSGTSGVQAASSEAIRGLQGLVADPDNGFSERTITAVDQLLKVTEELEQAKEDGKTGDALKPYEDAYEEAFKYAELQATIDEMAAKRGLDAEQIAIQAEAIQSNFTGEINGIEIQGQLTAEAIADMAAEMISASNAATKLKSQSKDLYKNINSKDAAAASSALKELEKDVIALIGAEGDAVKAGPSFREYLKENQDTVEAAANGNEQALNKLRQAYVNSSIAEGGLLDDVAIAAENLGKTEDFNNIKSSIDDLGESISSLQADGLWNIGEALTRGLGGVGDTLYSTIDGLMALGPAGQAAAQAIGDAFGFNISHVDVSAESLARQNYKGVVGVEGVGGAIDYREGSEAEALIAQGGTVKIPVITPKAGGSPGQAGGGGGGGPKKVAQTRRSQVVKRYKNADAQRSTNKNRRDNMSKKTDKLYGESRITNLQKENKLLEEGLRLNEKKAEEALKNLKVDEESLRTMIKKYGYELELDSEGNIKNYEQILSDIYDELNKLELDGELSAEETKLKETLEIKKQEIEGAMEDWEDTLKQLEELNNEYEELIDEMHSNELEQITYKLEFELELNELDTEWYDFLNEQIGDDFTQAVDTMDLITEKIKIANDNINLYKQSVTDLMENIENDPNRSLITGYLQDGVLTDDETEILKEAYSGIIEQLSALAEAKTSAEELLVSIFEGYKERIDFDTAALEHYTSLLEHFGNVVDIVGQKQLGLSDQFMENIAKMRIQQSRDIMSAAQSELAAYEQIRAEAEEELARAREEGRTNDIDYWQQQLDNANTSIQEARDKLVTSFENNLNAIADAFDKAVERIVQTFNDAVYAFGGLEGLSEDYSFIRENTELMVQDYEKIYELSKLNRNINKTLNDSNIIAGKQKMIELQKEINDLQASGAELSKYDLEYLQAKYELRLAEIELENAQNAKDTVRLSKDSEGNWSYVYTASTEKIDEAQQKYEDALYKMQNLSYEYIDEMSEKIISASQDMMEEIQNLNKNNFENEQEYLEEVNRIKAKYAESLGVTEEELNKALANNSELYEKDWQSYSSKTGYAISESQNWIDRYAESTLGTLMKSTSDVADYMNNFSLALNELTNSLYRVAGDYYNGIDDAFAAAGITKEDFASFVTTNTKAIMDASSNTTKDIETQTSIMIKEYSIQTDKVTDIQRTLDTAIDVYGPYIREIRDLLKESAALTKELQNKDATYTYKQAADLFNSKYGEDYKIEMDAEGRWNKTVEGVKNEILQKHAEAKTDEEKKHYADMYTWLTSYILPYVTSLDTGGYTGEWGTSGRLAMLHEKELILNANDTANFLDALNVSRELVNRVIEMNARASSFGIGGLSPNSIQDFAQNLEQQVTITAEFPNAVDHNEIEEAFNNLINTASQYANKYKI